MREESFLHFDREWLSIVIDKPKEDILGMVIMSHGLTGDRVGPQRLLVQLAEELAEAGFVVCRFDYRDSGDSSGTFFETKFSKMEEDLTRVIAHLQKQFGDLPFALLGFSIGAIPCIQILSQLPPKILILLSSDLIDAPPAPSSDIKEINFRNGAFFLTSDFFIERSKISPRKILETNRIPTFLCYGEKDHKVKAASIDLKELGVIPYELKGVDHLFESCLIRQELTKYLISLFKETFHGTHKPDYSMSHC